MVDGKPPAAHVLARLDALLATPGPALLVAHHAPVEAAFTRRSGPSRPRTTMTSRECRGDGPDIAIFSL